MTRRDARSDHAIAAFHAVLAFVMWGLLPIYFHFTAPTGAVEMVAWRIVASVAFCALALTVVRRWGAVRALWRSPRVVALLGAASAAIVVNWTLYVFAVSIGHTLEAALGYYLNPLMSMALGVVFLGERMRPLQWVAAGFALLAVVVLGAGYGQVPWIAIGLASAFALYGLVKKQVGGQVDPLAGFMVETTAVLPIAAGMFVWAAATTGITAGHVSLGHTVLIALAGVVTSVPLLLFASGARHLSLVEMGMIQYVAPTLQFLVGVIVFGEAMPFERWVGFALVWVALVVFSVDQWRRSRSRRAADAAGSRGSAGA